MKKCMYLGLVKFSAQWKFSAIMQVLTLRLDSCSQSYRHISAWRRVWRGWWSGRHQRPLPLGPPSTYWPAPWLLHCKPWCRDGGYQSGRLEWEDVLHEPIASHWQWVNPCLLVMIIVFIQSKFFLLPYQAMEQTHYISDRTLDLQEREVMWFSTCNKICLSHLQ